MKKYLMAAVALICMTMTSVVFTSCSEEKTEYKSEKVYYKLSDDIKYSNQEAAVAFTTELSNLMASIQNTVVDENNLINRLQTIVDTYNNQYLQGNLYLQRSSDGSNFTTIKTFTMKYAE